MHRPGPTHAYLIALAAVSLATLIRWLLEPLLGSQLTHITYLLAVIGVAGSGALGPALATLIAGAALAELLFVTPGPDWNWDLSRYLIVGAAVVAAGAGLQAALRRADRHQALLASTVRNALDCIVMIDHRDRVIEFNEAAERTFGYRRDEALGREMADLIIPERLRARHRAALQRYLETGVKTILDRRLEVDAMRADGSEFPVELSVTRITGSEPPIFTAYVRDISERQQARRALRESDQRFDTVINQLRDYAVFLMDADGRASTWNEGVERVLGFGQAEFIGLDVREAIFTPEDIAAGIPQEELRVAAERGTAGDDRWMRRKDGVRIFAIGVTVSRRDENGRLLGFAKIMRDQTARKQLEEELRETASRLAHVNRQQSQFLAMLSHELRNPLAPIRNGVAILRMTGARGDQSDRAIDMIGRQVDQLVRLIDDLIDINRIRGGKIRLRRETIDLVPSLAQAIETAQAQCGNSGQRLSIAFPEERLWVDGDPARIGQVVSNLVHNACKFTPRDGQVHLSAERDGAQAVIRVRDSGMGIPFDQLERIFGMFEQLEHTSGSVQGGLGIGLTLSRTLVEMHGGTIEARSEGQGRGSEFIVRLPLAPAPPERPSAPEALAPVRPRRVLVVDDSQDAAASLAEVIRLSGHEVHCAHDGEAALVQAARHSPEIVLLDIGLPQMDGYQVARELRSRANGESVTLIAVTGWGQEEDVKRAHDAGFDAHVTKPIDYPALLEILARGA